MITILLAVVVSLAALLALAAVIGARLPRGHQIARTVRLPRTADDVWRAIRDVDAAPSWRRGVSKIEHVDGDATRWHERSRHGVISYSLDESSPPDGARAGRMITRITDEALPYGGRWIFVVATDGDGCRLTVTEDGFVAPPLFRFLARFVFGHATTIEHYLRDLCGHLGVAATPAHAAPLL